MEMLVGPLLERNGKFSYDTFMLPEGLRSSFRYLRIDAARYDQRALIAEAERDPRCKVRICDTQTEFEQSVAALQSGNTTTDEPERKD
jgi:hypothetical protein